MEYLITSSDSVLARFPNAGIMLVGDFNRLDYQFLCNHSNLQQIVKNPTRHGMQFLTLSLQISRAFTVCLKFCPASG
jgi:hypothetical protein